ncbi:MAG: hypothetical protein QOE20_3149 [Mycobacterium sp.]|nr:hypothetical protein [Mycobacterium sp.]
MCVVTALVALVNVNAYGDTPCGNWVSPNYPKTADFESERPYGLKTKTADESTAVACTNAIASKTPTIVIFGVTTLALLTVGVLRRYQPSGVGPRRDPTKFPLSGQVCSRSISRLRATASHSLQLVGGHPTESEDLTRGVGVQEPRVLGAGHRAEQCPALIGHRCVERGRGHRNWTCSSRRAWAWISGHLSGLINFKRAVVISLS